MNKIDYDSAIPPVSETCPNDVFENAIREYGPVAACEWFGYSSDSDFTKETVRLLRERSERSNNGIYRAAECNQENISDCIAELEAKISPEGDKNAEFEAITRPVIAWLNANYHPHVTVVIEPTSAVLSEGAIAYTTHDYVRG